ncbi:MFS transporter [soil metagenome]
MTDRREPPYEAGRISAARMAVSASFIFFGMILGLWFVHIPVVVRRLGLEHAVLGLALLCFSVGAVFGSTGAAWVLDRWGLRRGGTALLVLSCAMLPIAVWSPVRPVLFIIALILGVLVGATNVAVNRQASDVEKARGKPTMSSFHGFFSLGSLAGSAIGGTLIGWGWGDGHGAGLVEAVTIAAALALARYVLPDVVQARVAAAPRAPRFILPAGAVAGLAAMAILSNAAEGAIGDWSALYLATMRGFAEGTAGTGLVLFAGAMALCRLAGGPVVEKLGEQTIVCGGGLLVALGIAIVLLLPWAEASPFGFALFALGLSNIAPVLYGAGSRLPGVEPTVGIASISTAQLGGLLVAPPIIGFVAQSFGLAVALGLLILAGLGVAFLATRERWTPRAATVTA